ncbi:hypothetical protein V8E53_010344 [Lactarius tabidus]
MRDMHRDDGVALGVAEPVPAQAHPFVPEVQVNYDGYGAHFPVADPPEAFPGVQLHPAPPADMPPAANGLINLVGRFLNNPGTLVNMLRIEPGPGGRFESELELERLSGRAYLTVHSITESLPSLKSPGASELGKGIVDILKVGCAPSITLSPGLNPSVAIFVREKNGQSPKVNIHSLHNRSTPSPCKKTFFKLEKSQNTWNNLGTLVLVLTQTDHRYKEGPIHDFAWSPNSKEFGVVYGFMPARVMLFDQRVRTLHDFGTPFYNFVSFNPVATGPPRRLRQSHRQDQRRRPALANQYIDHRHVHHLALRVVSRRQLLHVQDCEELYQTSWRPTPVDSTPPFPAVIPPSPSPSPSVRAATAIATAKPLPARTAGAYRPPGARGPSASLAYSRKGDGGSPSGTPRGWNSGPVMPTCRPIGYGRRYVPDAAEASQNTDAGNPPKRKGPEEKGGHLWQWQCRSWSCRAYCGGGDETGDSRS